MEAIFGEVGVVCCVAREMACERETVCACLFVRVCAPERASEHDEKCVFVCACVRVKLTYIALNIQCSSLTIHDPQAIRVS